MASYCVYRPKHPERAKLWDKLQKAYGREKAKFIYNRVNAKSFMQEFKDTLATKDGVPVFESVITNPLVADYLGEDSVMEALNNVQPVLDNTLENTERLMQHAYDINSRNIYNNYVAIVDYTPEGKLTLSIDRKNQKNIDTVNYQSRIHAIHHKIVDILKPIGITIGMLSEAETAVGRVGHTDFNKAVDTADGFSRLIRVANNMEGYAALSEEFSHLLIGVFRDNPLVQRSISLLTDEAEARDVLGKEFQDVYDYHDGNMDMVAEEAVGHVLRDVLLNYNNNNAVKKKKSLFRRMVDAIVNKFKGINPGYYDDAITQAKNDLGAFAEKIMNNDERITRKKVLESKRDADFNALSKLGKTQVQVAKMIAERFAKLAALTQNYEGEEKGDTQKGHAFQLAEQVREEVMQMAPTEETIAAIAAILDLAQGQVDNLRESIRDIDSMSMHDKFVLMMNILRTLEMYAPTIKDLQGITAEEYMQDEQIRNQNYVLEDYTENTQDYEYEEDNVVDTSGMSSEQIVEKMVEESKKLELADDDSHYKDSRTNRKKMRVTKTIESDENGEPFNPDSPWVTPSTNIGTGIDELTRDFISGRIRKEGDDYYVEDTPIYDIYPNMTPTAMKEFVDQLDKFIKAQRRRGITLVARDITVDGNVTVVDGIGRAHKINVAGTLDVLGYDKNGNWYIYDMKTHRSQINSEKKAKYARQLSLYKKFLEDKYGINVKEMNVIPIKVTYPAPKGHKGSDKEYTVYETKHPLYLGRKANQLEINGEDFVGANPNLEGLIPIEEKELKLSYKKLTGDYTNGMGNAMQATIEALKTLDLELERLSQALSKEMLPKFLEFLKPFVGENIKVRDIDPKTGKFRGRMKVVSIKQVLEEAPRDVTLVQKWLTTMADNPDTFLQIIDKVVKKTKDNSNQELSNFVKEILAFGKEFEDLGIKNYDWMFEGDKQNYILHYEINGKDYSYDLSDYKKAQKAFYESLNSKYGKNVIVGSEAAKKKKKERQEWIKNNTIAIEDENGDTIQIPDPKKFPSKWHNLSPLQKDFYNKFMTLKGTMDGLIGPEKTTLTNTIKIRKLPMERAKSMFHGKPIKEMINAAKTAFTRSFDDDIKYKREAKGIRGFAGEEILKLPLYYLKADDASDISTDVISTLIAYADMAYNYNAMNTVVNQLEIGREIAKHRKIKSTRGDKNVFEQFSYGGRNYKNQLYINTETSNFMEVLNDFFESKIYNRYLSDSGEIWGMDVNKITSFLLKLGSNAQLGVNIMAGLANVATGISMQNIEAAASEFFNAKELAKADAIFVKEMAPFMAEIGSRIKKSKLALFDELFNVRQNFSTTLKQKQWTNRYLLTRVFGPGIQYICQDAGDHWLYNRAAIAIALRYKLMDTKNGNKEISLWDALEKEDVVEGHPERGQRLKVRDGVVKKDGTEFSMEDISDVTADMRYINQHCFGVYNDEDTIMARRTIVGRFLMQYRDWMPPQLRYRFGSMTTNLEKHKDKDGNFSTVEGYYRTVWRIGTGIRKELMTGNLKLSQVWNELEDFERRNIIRATTELTQYGVWVILGAILAAAGWKDKDSPWMKRMLSYLVTREKTELGSLVPTLSMPGEMLTIMKSPFANTSIISDLFNTGMCLYPYNYTDEIKSGDYKGHSTAYRAFMRSPLTLYYRNVKRTFNPEKAEQYYNQNK